MRLAAALCLIFFRPLAFGQQSAPDLILFNGKVFTSNSSHPFVEALAIRGERIVALGASKEIVALAGPETKRLNLGERVVIPGINDAHRHLDIVPRSFGLRFKDMDPKWSEVERELASAIGKTPKGALIVGEVGPTAWDDPKARRTRLDQLAANRPVLLWTWTRHAAILSTAALRKFAVREDEPDPLGGRYLRLAGDGKLNGVALEFAAFRLDRRLSEMATDEEALQQTRDLLNQAVRLGITSVQNMCGLAPGRCVALFEKAPTPIRIRMMRFLLTDQNGRIAGEGRELPAHPTPLLTVSGTKWVLDGTPIERTAALRKPYADRPNTSGWLSFNQKEMEAMLQESLQNDDQLLVHLAGDRATETFLNAMDATGGRAVWSRRRVRIEHGDGIMPDLIARSRELGVVVVQNPSHLMLRELLVRRFDRERTAQMQPLRSLLEAGIPLAIGSDGPLNPYLNIMFASTYPGKPKEALTREQAVTAYTLTAAYAEFAELNKGSLEQGKLADLAVLSQDIFRIPAADLPKTESVLTLVGGKIVYDAKVVVPQ